MANRRTSAQQKAFNECHVFRHWWKPTIVDESNPSCYVQHMECMRCGGVRKWKVNRVTGDPLPSANSYNMAEGYYNKSDDPIAARKQLRLNEIEANRSRKSRMRAVS